MPFSDDWGESDATAKTSSKSGDTWEQNYSSKNSQSDRRYRGRNSQPEDDSGWGSAVSTETNRNETSGWDSWDSSGLDSWGSSDNQNKYSEYSSSKGFGRGTNHSFNYQRRENSNFDLNDRENRSGGYQQRGDFNRDNSDKTTIKIPSGDVGRVIGRGGATIKELQSKSGARIKVHNNQNNFDNDNETSIDLFGSAEVRSKAEELISEVIGQSRPCKQQRIFEDSKQTSETPADTGFIDWDLAVKESTEAIKKKWSSLPPIKKEFYFEDPEISAMHPEEVEQFRLEKNNIIINRFSEDDVRPIPNPIKQFDQAFSHFPEILDEIAKQGFDDPSPIQCQSWPILLQGMDLIGVAQTGTGKTLAYLLPALVHIDEQPQARDERKGPTALILAPTRELAQQIERESKKYTYKGIKTMCVYGGGDRRAQIEVACKGVEIVIATPGRLNDLCMNNYMDLSSVSYLVIDEADRMLDLGFEPQIKKVMIDVRPDKQTVMMSATWPVGVQRLALNFMTDPLRISIGTLNLSACHSVTQEVLIVAEEEKREVIYDFVKNMQPTDKVIVYVAKKCMVDELSSDFALKGINCQSIHGGRDQGDREQALVDLRDSSVRILVATDVAARGLDIDDITHVFIYDFPRNIEEYVHRIGRTGRAGRQGNSITLLSRDDWKHAQELIDILIEAEQELPPSLISMAERYKVWKAKRDAELELLGPRPRRGGGGGGRFGGGGGGRSGGSRW